MAPPPSLKSSLNVQGKIHPRIQLHNNSTHHILQQKEGKKEGKKELFKMGSLMAGWDSHIQDPKFAKLMRNKSMTKERIEEYWRSKRKTEEEHSKSIPTSPVDNNSDHMSCFSDGSSKEYKRSSSLPMVDTKEGNLKPTSKKDDIDLEELKRNCWWTRSNWAFLNERPVIDAEVPTYKYASQHHVTTFVPTKMPDSRIPGI